MKSTTHPTFPDNRRALFAATVAVLISAGTAFAQSSGSAGATSSGSSQKNPSSTSSSDRSSSDSSSSKSGSSYNTGSSTYSSGTGATGGSTTTSGAGSTTAASPDTSATAAGAPTGRDTMSSNKLSWGDRRFVTKAADSGKAEVQIAQLAAQQASNPEVKSFAQKLVEDHSKVNSELTSIAGSKNVKLDDDDGKDRHYNRLAKKTGSEFDQEFVEHMIEEHEDAVKMFEKAASDAKDPEVRSFASKHVDHLREHLQTAQGLRSTIMPTGRTDDTSSSATGTSSRSSTTPSSSSTSDTSRDSSSSSGTSSKSGSDSSSPGTSATGSTGSSSSDTSGSSTRRPDNR